MQPEQVIAADQSEEGFADAIVDLSDDELAAVSGGVAQGPNNNW